MKTKVIEKQLAKYRQSVVLTSYEQYDDVKVKISINSDSYNAQCNAFGYVQDKTTREWNLIYTIPQPLMNTESKLAYRDFSEDDFKMDYNKIKKQLKLLIF